MVKAVDEVDQGSAFSGRNTRGAGSRMGACEGNEEALRREMEKGGGGVTAAPEKVKREVGAAKVVEGPANALTKSQIGKDVSKNPPGKFIPKFGKKRGGAAAGRGRGSGGVDAAKEKTDSEATTLDGEDGASEKEELVGGGPGAVSVAGPAVWTRRVQC